MKYASQEGNEDLSDWIKDDEPMKLNEDYNNPLGDYNFNIDEED